MVYPAKYGEFNIVIKFHLKYNELINQYSRISLAVIKDQMRFTLFINKLNQLISKYSANPLSLPEHKPKNKK